MFGLLIPLLGLGNSPTLVVLTFYAIYPILRSTYTGLQGVPAACIEAANGLGFSNFQRLWLIELPLALPVIISGLRVATAMTIGITTIAAFIGAGGLGDFIMQGLSLNDSSLILLGAIPIALLALVFDYGISQIEIQLQTRKTKLSKFPRIQKFFLATGGLMAVALIGTPLLKEVFTKKEGSITIGSKNFIEQYLLAEIMAQLIEAKTSLKVTRKFNLGTTDIVHQAMLEGEVDLYPEYSGTAYMIVLKKPQKDDEHKILEEVKSAYKEKFNLVWLDSFGFSNSQSLAVKKDVAQKYHLQSLSDLKRISPELKIAAPPEFLKRSDAFPGLSKVYGLRFKKTLQMDPNLMYKAVAHQKVDVIAAFTTDGKLQKYNLVILKDDQGLYPSYQAAPVIRQSVLDAYPQVYQAILPLFGCITQEKMTSLNSQIDVEGLTPSEVAHQFLSELEGYKIVSRETIE